VGWSCWEVDGERPHETNQGEKTVVRKKQGKYSLLRKTRGLMGIGHPMKGRLDITEKRALLEGGEGWEGQRNKTLKESCRAAFTAKLQFETFTMGWRVREKPRGGEEVALSKGGCTKQKGGGDQGELAPERKADLPYKGGSPPLPKLIKKPGPCCRGIAEARTLVYSRFFLENPRKSSEGHNRIRKNGGGDHCFFGDQGLAEAGTFSRAGTTREHTNSVMYPEKTRQENRQN